MFVMDGPRTEIYESRLSQADELLVLNRMMARATAHHGCGFIDLTTPMAEDFAHRGQRFNNDLDFHWNETGHELVARELNRWLSEGPIGDPPAPARP